MQVRLQIVNSIMRQCWLYVVQYDDCLNKINGRWYDAACSISNARPVQNTIITTRLECILQ